ncbi:hypothetical protein [Maricaulis sp.]|uniref:hypothetical protein n=1 Tax=Maricaulis sp. TaxID=1486257 RepID=UPI00261D6FDC|nr:hypothetical protein [Maricaulis sp.]
MRKLIKAVLILVVLTSPILSFYSLIQYWEAANDIFLVLLGFGAASFLIGGNWLFFELRKLGDGS